MKILSTLSFVTLIMSVSDDDINSFIYS